MLDKTSIKKIFGHLESGNGDLFFSAVRDDVDWTVMGTHPLAGHYSSKQDFLTHTFGRLDKVLKEGTRLAVVEIFLDGNVAIVEMRGISTAINGKPFENRYCWICTFDDQEKISIVRAYLDSALVAELLAENELQPGNSSEYSMRVASVRYAVEIVQDSVAKTNHRDRTEFRAAMVEDAPLLPGLSPIAGKRVHVDFDGGRLTSDGGVLLLAEIEKKLGLAERLAS